MHPAVKMWGIAVLLSCLFGGIVAACSHPTYPQTPQVDTNRALSRSLVEVAETAWMQTAKACVATSEESGNTALLTRCENVMGSVTDSFDVANSALDTWTAADQKLYACAAKDIVQGIVSSADMVQKAGGKVTPIVSDLQVLATMIPLNCSDAGADAGGQ